MAGGLGKRMESPLPKVLHKISGIPMICHILLKLKVLSNIVNINKIIIVVGKYKDVIKEELDRCSDILPDIEYVIQDEPLGTGHAIQCCINDLSKFPGSEVLILSGDVPLLSLSTMNKLVNMNEKVKIITTRINDPTGYGRIIEVNEKMLFKNNDLDKANLLKEAPFTIGLPEKSPDRFGQFLGWQMVRHYMKKNKITLEELIKIPYNNILQEYEIEE